MKIIIATGSFGGPATYSKLLAEKLPAFGYEVAVVSFGDVLKYPKILRHMIYFSRLLNLGKDAEIFYAQDPISVGLPVMYAAKILHRRFFLKIVGDYAWEQAQQRFGVTDLLDDFVKRNTYSFPVKFFKWLETFVAKRAEKIIVPSEYLKGIVSKWGIDREKIHVVYNAFVKPQLTETKEELRQKLNFEFPTIVSVGRLVPWKNFPIVIESFSSIIKKFPKAKLIIIDDGPDKEKLKWQVIELGLTQSVTFLGRIPLEEVYKNIKAADVFVLVSSYEGFSHLILETLALGTPIVTTPAGGNIEIIKDTENGLMIPIQDVVKTQEAILKILNDKTLSSAISKKGLQSVEGFTESNMLKALTAILR